MQRLALTTQAAVASAGLLLLTLATAALALSGAPFGLLAGSFAVLALAAAVVPLWLGRRASCSLRLVAERIGGADAAAAPAAPEDERAIVEAVESLKAELRQRSQDARESEDRYLALAESLPALVWVFDQHGITVFQNRRATDFTGGVILKAGRERASIVHPDDVEYLLAQRHAALKDRQEYRMEVRLRRYDGSYRWYQITTTPISILVGEQREAYWLATGVDVENLKEAEDLQADLNVELERRVDEATRQLREETSVRQKAERQLRQTQKMEAISRLTGGIAHDLNNKLMVISANIDAVTKHIKDQPQLRRKLLAALVASDQAAALMSKLLAFARQRDLQVQYIDIAEHLDSITSLLDRSFLSDSVEVRLQIPEDLWPVEVDPHELETAVVNLAVNARDAMSRGGTIEIEARNVRLRRGSLSDPDISGDFVQIAITDTGAGIAPQDLEHVFEPFFTTKEASRASGLGLSQVHGFARQLGGTVEIASTIGEGTAVTLFLPRADLPARIGAKPELEDILDDEESAASADVLVVDDEVEVALALQAMLQELGYAARIAIGADEALEAVKARRPDLLLTDVTMPGTRDGVALAREVRALDGTLPVVLITGNPMVVAQSSEFPLLQKPIVSRDLHAALQRYLTPGPDKNVVSLFQDRQRGP